MVFMTGSPTASNITFAPLLSVMSNTSFWSFGPNIMVLKAPLSLTKSEMSLVFVIAITYNYVNNPNY